jgi:putative restriction endonuclease
MREISATFKYFTKSFLIESNNASIREKRNHNLSEHYLEGLEDKLYFVLDHFDHSKDEVRVQIIFDLDSKNLGLLDLSRNRFDLLPTINFFEDGSYELDDSELVNFRPYSKEREWQEIVVRKPVRKQGDFRKNVLRAYNGQCAVCSIKTKSLLRAAHIIPVADGGDDSIKNGICLCVLHEVAFDRCLLRITPEGDVLVKEDEVLNVEFMKIRFPQRVEDHPSNYNLRRKFEQL